MLATIYLATIFAGPALIFHLIFAKWRLDLVGSFLLSYLLFVGIVRGAMLVSQIEFIGYSYLMFLLIAVIILIRKRIWIYQLRNLCSSKERIVDIVLIVAFTAYILVVGPYTEIPADIYEHLSNIQGKRLQLMKGVLDAGQPWYLLLAFALQLAGQEVSEILIPMTIFCTCLFILMISKVTKLLIRKVVSLESSINLLVLLSALLTLLTFGTSVFSYIRYYVFAPGYLLYPIFLYAGYLLVEILLEESGDTNKWLRVVLVLGAVLLAYIIHKQEALFLVVLFWFAWGCRLVNCFRRVFATTRIYGDKKVAFFIEALSFVLITVLGYLAVPSESGVVATLYNNTIQLSNIVPTGRPWLIADPTGRVYETLGLWGLAVSCIYLVAIPKSYKHRFLSILIVLPWLLVFNPVFVGKFVVLTESSVLWRFVYMVPLGIVGSYCIGYFLYHGKSKLKLYFVTILLVLLLIPIPGLKNWQHLRYTTLLRVPDQNSHILWSDLIEELSEYRNWKIMTDPVTGYVLTALTGNRHWHNKFTKHTPDYHEYNKDYYVPSSFVDYKSGKWLIVVNLRDGGKSINGKRSGHWSEDIMKVSSQYNAKFLSFVNLDNITRRDAQAEPITTQTRSLFVSPLWSNEKIWLFNFQ